MQELINNKGRAAIAFGILLVVCGLAAFVPTNLPMPVEGIDKPMDTANVAWMLIATSLVLLMTPGLAFFYGGMVTRKSIISTMLQSFICLGVVSLLWFVVGFSLAFGDDWGGYGFVGNPMTYFLFHNVGLRAHPTLGSGLPFVLFAAFQLKFAVITPALITGSFAERVKFWAYVFFVNLFVLFIYCPLAHMAWHPDGILFKMGVLDFAGGTVVHIAAGCAALAGALVIGRRTRNDDDDAFPVNIPYVILGTGLLWFGWFGFNAGSALAANGAAINALVNTHFASAVAAITWIMMDVLQGKKPSALGACIGAVVGLVAITPAAGYVHYGPSLFIGFAAAIVSNFAVVLLNRSKVVDDTLDVFPCHGIGGITGMLLTAVFAVDGGKGLITGDAHLLKMHLAALALVVVFTFGGSFLLFKLTNLITPLRVDEASELEGLDLSQHDETLSSNLVFRAK